MSNRSLIEINHDFAGDIKRDPQRFVEAILEQLRSGSGQPRELCPGVRYFGIRHHSYGFKIKWGGYEAEEQDDRP